VESLEFRILGPIEVVSAGTVVRLGGRRQRAVLAILLLRANQVVPVERLAEDLYGGGNAPATAVGQVRDHVSQLRKLLAANGNGASPLETRAPGYVLRVEPEQIDANRFERELDAAAAELQSGDASGAAARLREALRLWRGPPLADLAYEPFAHAEIERLEELRLTALGQRLDADLALGRDAALVAELESLVTEHPTREEFLRRLMLALYRSGRQAEAVDAYHAARRALVERHGMEISPDLRELVGKILRQDSDLDLRERPTTAAAAANPYKGLRAFVEADADDFFGREALIDRLVRRVRESRFVAVVGPSGSGKSSVVRAGLVPAVRSASLHVIVISPGAYPFEELEAALLRIAINPPPSLLAQLEQDDRGLLRAVKRILPDDDSELVVVVDQFEELFTLVGDEERRTQFLAAVERAVTEPLSRLRVVVTMRADFYDRPLQYRDFAELLREAVEIVPPLSPDEVERAITAPAGRVGVRIEEGLLAEVVSDVLEQPGALPLLQYALTELFERREDGVLTRAAYTAIGGVAGALAYEAEALYSGLSDAGRVATRQLFLRLVNVGDGSDTRRRADRDELASLDVEQRELDHALEAFGAARLLSFDRDPRSGAPTVEVAHEALLENWGRLRTWIDLAREDVVLRRRIAAAAREWRDSGRDSSFLLRGLQLARAEAAATRSNLAQTELERDFVAASLELRGAERIAGRRSVNRLRALVATLLVVSIAAAALAAFAFDQSAHSSRQAKIATARQLAASSVASLGVDPELSILLAMRAIETVPRNPPPEAVEALHRAIESSRIVLTIPHAGKSAVAFSRDGSRLATAGEGAAVWNARSGRRLFVLGRPTAAVHDVAYSSDGRRLATGGEDGGATVWNAATGTRFADLRDSGGKVSVSFSPDGARLATGDYAGVLRIWDLARRRAVRTFTSPHPLCGVAWSPDGSRVGAGDCGTNYGSASGRVWNVRTGRLVVVSDPRYGAALTLAFSHDGRHFATPNLDGTAEVWDARSGQLAASFDQHTGLVYALAYSPVGNVIATGGTDGTARLWDGATGVERLVLSSQTGIVNDVAFSRNGSRLATASEDGAARVWDISAVGSRDWLTIRAHPGGVESLYYAPGGRTLLTTGLVDGRAKLWNTRSGALLDVYQNKSDAAFRFTPADRIYFPVETTSPDARIAASARSDGTIQLRRASSGSVMRTLPSRHVTIHRLAFSRDGTRIAAGYLDGVVSVWDVSSGRQLRAFTAHNGIVEGVAFSPDGAILATAGEDTKAKLWNLRTGKETLTLGGNTFALSDIAYSPDGSRLATGSADGTVRIYVLPVSELMAVARQRLTRGWRHDECVLYLHGDRCPARP
jgi:WD40 repeat protein/DNA-binding SARP family transcriptional activator/energy-coupling factor transporter ATP-binding protein EcfA2